MHIRKATAAELDRILTIYGDARRFMREQGNPDQWGENYPPEALIRDDIARGCSYVCEEDDVLLGVFYCADGPDPDYEVIRDGAWPNDAPYGVIHRIAVAVRGRGVAAFCLDFGVSRYGNLRIDTHEQNLPMQRTLEKNGFARCGTVMLANGDVRIAYQKSRT